MLSSSGINTFDKTSDITHWLLVMLAATAKLHHILTKQLKFTAVLSITIPQPQPLTTNHYHLLHDTTVPVCPHIGQEISVSVYRLNSSTAFPFL